MSVSAHPAQELARQEEKMVLLEGGQQRAQEQLGERVAEVVRAEQAQRRLQAELRRLKEQLANAEQQSQDYRALADRLKVEAGESRQAHLSAQQEGLRLQQGAQQCEGELAGSRELVRTLQLQLQEQTESARALRAELAQEHSRQQELQNRAQSSRERENSLERESEELKANLHSTASQLKERERQVGSLQERVAELQSATLRLQEELAAGQSQLLKCRRELEVSAGHAQRRGQEASALEDCVSQLKGELGQEASDRAGAEQLLRELRLELASAQGSHRESMELLAERSRELAGLRSELSRVQQRGAQQLQERTALEDRASQLSAELHTLRSVSRHSQDEVWDGRWTREVTFRSPQRGKQQRPLLASDWISGALAHANTPFEFPPIPVQCAIAVSEVRAYEGRLAELSAQLTRAQRWGQEQLAALESREEEAVGMKVELASLREGYHSKANQVEALNSQLDMLKQRYRTAASEVDVLRQSLGTARTDSTRLQKESELVVSNVNQWVKEQKQANEKLGNTIKDQSKKIVHLTAEKDHLQGSVEALHRENRKLKAELDDSRIDAERLRALSVGQGVQSSGLLRVPSHRPAPVLRSDQVVRGSINAHRKKKPLAANLHS
ncbi:hypothetical protein COCON_G00101630 [Conger conger]|uniref:Polyamine-modulated factor 1-binding protein 1 n=1 Tax=Conger conger TaxID=82655 RepID=A0A9Q1HZ30_CONCO|nr:hypothetical protein COCON_G00101630 [Conger conger]